MVHTATEYRLVVDKGFEKKTHAKNDLAHAEKGLADAVRDFQRYKPPLAVAEARIETRLVTTTEWEWRCTDETE